MPAADIVAAARTLWEARPVAFYTWSGLEQHSGTTQTMRAINVLYALTGSLDVPGGNVLFEAVPSNPIDGTEFLSDARPPAVGVDKRPLGPARFEFVTGEDFYTAALDGRIKALVELRRQHGDGPRGQRPRSRGAARPGLLRPGRPVHDPDRRTRRHRAAGDHAVRVRGTEDRLRVQPGGAVARPAATAARRAARRGPLGPADRLRPRDAAGPRRSTSGTATSTRRSAISSRRAGSPWRSCGPTRRACGCR